MSGGTDRWTRIPLLKRNETRRQIAIGRFHEGLRSAVRSHIVNAIKAGDVCPEGVTASVTVRRAEGSMHVDGTIEGLARCN
jgi:hypothetical protein